MVGEYKSRPKGCIEAIGVIGGILGIITSVIVIYQFVSGNASLVNLFPSASQTAITTQATSTPTTSYKPTSTPSLALTPTPNPSDTTTPPPEPVASSSSFISIIYDNAWLWVSWTIVGALSGGLTFGIRSSSYEYWEWGAFFFGASEGIFVGTLSGLLSNLLINLFHIPYSFFISIGTCCVLAIITALVIFKLTN